MLKNRLRWEDVAESSMIRCRECDERLRYPVMEQLPLEDETTSYPVGNVCGFCAKTRHSLAIANLDVQTILSHLSIPCTYGRNGCNVEERFRKISFHETHCYYRNRICPFVHQGDCMRLKEIPDIKNHILSAHAHSVLVAENNSVTLHEPGFWNNVISYFLDFHTREFLLRIKRATKYSLYILYYFDRNNERNNLDDIPYTLVFQHGNLDLRYRNLFMIHESKMAIVYNQEVALKIEHVTFASLQFPDTMTLTFDFRDRKVEVDDRFITCFTCWNCHTYCTRTAHFCKQCGIDVKFCTSCFILGGRCPSCGCETFHDIDFSSWCENFKFPCLNEGCHERIWGEDYDFHSPHCGFKRFACPFAGTLECAWAALYKDIPNHLIEAHAEFVNCESITTELVDESSPFVGTVCCVLNNNTIRVNYKCTLPGTLSLTVGIIGPILLRNKHLWKVILRKGMLKTTMSRVCDNWKSADAEYIDVGAHVFDNKVDFTIYVERIY